MEIEKAQEIAKIYGMDTKVIRPTNGETIIDKIKGIIYINENENNLGVYDIYYNLSLIQDKGWLKDPLLKVGYAGLIGYGLGRLLGKLIGHELITTVASTVITAATIPYVDKTMMRRRNLRAHKFAWKKMIETKKEDEIIKYYLTLTSAGENGHKRLEYHQPTCEELCRHIEEIFRIRGQRIVISVSEENEYIVKVMAVNDTINTVKAEEIPDNN